MLIGSLPLAGTTNCGPSPNLAGIPLRPHLVDDWLPALNGVA